MKYFKLWMLTAIFSLCGANMLTSCAEEDNPVVDPDPEPVVVNPQRVEFQQQFTNDLNAVKEAVNLDPTLKAIQILTSFTDNLDAEAFGAQINDIMTQILSNMYAEQPTCQLLNFADLGDLEDEALDAVNTQLGIENPVSFLLVNAYNSIGTRHMTFKPGSPVAEITVDDALVLEYQDTEQGETTEVRLEFSDASDGVIIFAAKLLGSPVAVQLPEKIGVTITTGKTGEPREVLKGFLMLSSMSSKYISFKGSDWDATLELAASVAGRTEQIDVVVTHAAEGEMNLAANLAINDQSLLSIAALGVRDPYTAEEMEQLKELREMGALYSAAYDLLKAFNGRSIQDIMLTINGNVSIDCNINDVAEGLLALGNIHQLHKVGATKEEVDVFTQKLNEVVKFKVYQFNTAIAAEGKLLTILKEGEYQPAVALRFEGETEYQTIYENMSEQDLQNYNAIIDSFKEPVAEFAKLFRAFRVKAKAIKDASIFNGI